jgi:hypothetical protein
VSPEVLEQLDLSQSTLCENLLAEDICDLFDGDTLVGSIVHRSALSCEGQHRIVRMAG